MRRLLLLLSILTVLPFTSCNNAAEEPAPDPSKLALDLQNGYWEVDFTSSKSVLKFSKSTVTSYWIEGNPSCITETHSQNYLLKGNILTMPSSENSLILEIKGDVLILFDEVDQMMIEFDRKVGLDYPDC